MKKDKWIVAWRCGFCNHIYYNKHYHFDEVCPKCGHKNYMDNPWPGDHFEHVLIRKRWFHKWEYKEVEPDMQRTHRFDKKLMPYGLGDPYDSNSNFDCISKEKSKTILDNYDFPDEDKPLVLELVKDYLKGTWVITELTKEKEKTKYKCLKLITKQKANDYNIITYITDKKPYIKENNKKTPQSIIKPYPISKTETFVVDNVESITAYSLTGKPIYSFSNIPDAKV